MSPNRISPHTNMLHLLSNTRTAIRMGKESPDICSMTALTKEPWSQMFLPQQGRTIKRAMGHAGPRMIPKTFFLRVFTVYFSCLHPETLYTHNRTAHDGSEERTLWKAAQFPSSSLPGETPSTLATFLSDLYNPGPFPCRK